MKEDSISQNNFSTHSISNFKAFKDLQGIEIAPITLIYGQNSGGKSTFIQSILALSQSRDSIPKAEIKFSGNNINVGTFETIQHRPSKGNNEIIFISSTKSSLKKKKSHFYIDAFDPIRNAKIRYEISSSFDASKGQIKRIKLLFDGYLEGYFLDFEISRDSRIRQSIRENKNLIFNLSKDSFKQLSAINKKVYERLIKSFQSISNSTKESICFIDIGIRDESNIFKKNKNFSFRFKEKFIDSNKDQKDIWYLQLINMLRFAAIEANGWIGDDGSNLFFVDFNNVLDKNKKKYLPFIKNLGNQIMNFHFDQIIKENFRLDCELNKKEDILYEDPTGQRNTEIISINDIEIRYFLKSQKKLNLSFSQLKHEFLNYFLASQTTNRKNKYQLPYIDFLKKMQKFASEIPLISDQKKTYWNSFKTSIDNAQKIGNGYQVSLTLEEFSLKALRDVKDKCRLIIEEIFSIFDNLKFDRYHQQRSIVDDYFKVLDETEKIIDDTFKSLDEFDKDKDNTIDFNTYEKLWVVESYLDIYEKSLISILLSIDKLFIYNFISTIFKKDNQSKKISKFFLKDIFLFLLGVDESKISFSSIAFRVDISDFNESFYKTKERLNYFKDKLLNSYKSSKYIVASLISENPDHFDEIKFLPFSLFNKLALPNELSQEIIHLGPARPGAKRFYTSEDIDNLNPSDVAYLLKLKDHTKPGFINKLNKVCKYINFLDSIKTAPVRDRSLDAKKIEVKTPGSKTYVNIADTGYGLSQLLPIIIHSISQENKTILIQQPETHLHPRLQAEVGTLMINSLDLNINKNWIVETHSEILLLRILKKIRLGEFDSNNLRVYYVDQKKDKGSFIKRMFVNDNGELVTHWPEGFFSNDIDEIFDI